MKRESWLQIGQVQQASVYLLQNRNLEQAHQEEILNFQNTGSVVKQNYRIIERLLLCVWRLQHCIVP